LFKAHAWASHSWRLRALRKSKNQQAGMFTHTPGRRSANRPLDDGNTEVGKNIRESGGSRDRHKPNAPVSRGAQQILTFTP
jgi:hypothetical protein